MTVVVDLLLGVCVLNNILTIWFGRRKDLTTTNFPSILVCYHQIQFIYNSKRDRSLFLLFRGILSRKRTCQANWPIKKSAKASAWLADLDRFFQLSIIKTYRPN